jgi:hypothetical protein
MRAYELIQDGLGQTAGRQLVELGRVQQRGSGDDIDRARHH